MSGGWMLLAGLVPLAIGPLLAVWFDRRPAVRGALDSFVAVTLGGLVLLHLWPHAFRAAGWLAVVAGLAGLMLPYLFHGFLHAREEKAFAGVIGIAFLGLALHAVLDGAALIGPSLEEAVIVGEASAETAHDPDHQHHEHGANGHGADGKGAEEGVDHDHGGEQPPLLATAVVLHRLPMALAIWWLVVPALGRRLALLILVTLGAGTVVGFLLAGRFLVGLSTPAAAVFEALVGGMLLHVLLGHEHRHERRGALPAGSPVASRTRWLTASSALLGVALLVGLTQLHPVERLLPEALGTGETFLRVALAVAPWWLAGAVVVALWGRLAPWLTWVVALPLLGPLTTVLGGAVVGVGGGIGGGVGGDAAGDSPAGSPGARGGRFSASLLDLVQQQFPWLLVGVALVAWTEPMLRLDLPWLGRLLLALALGAAASRSLLLAVPLAYLLLLKGWSSPWALLLLLTAVVLPSRRRARAALLAVVALALASWLEVQGWAPDLAFDLAAGRPTAWWAWGGLAVAVILGLGALFRLGFRGFVAPVQKALVLEHRHR